MAGPVSNSSSNQITPSLGDILLPRALAPRVRWQGKKQVLSEMSAMMAAALGLDSRLVHEAVLERERLGSTGVGEGVAIPHARIETLSRPVAGFARLLEPADFEAIDERPADLIFMLLAPTDSGADHLRALARAARVFRQERIRNALRQAQSAETVLAILAPDLAIDAA
ncbi:MAG: transcriptional regulator [Rhodobacterales bacterium 12-64-8]|nr:MAG: transcriptional regulator [Rhodobacterales bacterium 12-64-8]OYX46071.1 MAG: transcriptional regulator [Alphaproteobacteria bacterium 32-64-14]